MYRSLFISGHIITEPGFFKKSFPYSRNNSMSEYSQTTGKELVLISVLFNILVFQKLYRCLSDSHSAGFYQAVVSNVNGSVTSDEVELGLFERVRAPCSLNIRSNDVRLEITKCDPFI